MHALIVATTLSFVSLVAAPTPLPTSTGVSVTAVDVGPAETSFFNAACFGEYLQCVSPCDDKVCIAECREDFFACNAN